MPTRAEQWKSECEAAEAKLTPAQVWRVQKARALRHISKWDEAEHPRASDGEFTDAGGGDGGGSDKPSGGGKGKGKHPGEGYSKGAYIKNGVIHTSNVYDAQLALFQDKKVELAQPKQVSTLIKRLGQTAKEMAKHGEEAPVFNLCNVSIAGTNLFCAETKGIPRVEMPVIPAKQTKAFIKFLEKRGYEVSKEKEFAANLRATQTEISGAKVAASMKRIKDEGIYKRIFVAKDDYILDGHHTWAGAIGVDAQNNTLSEKKNVKVARVNIPITKLIDEAKAYNAKHGITGKPASEAAKEFMIPVGQAFSYHPILFDMTDYNEKEFNEDEHPRDESGRWTSGGGDGGGDSVAPSGKPSGYHAHPGKGYSKDAYVDSKGVIQTTDVYDAQRALFENKRVNLDQPRKVSILIQKLGTIAKEMKDKGEKAPTFNLCNVTVSGTNLFCADTKGIPRVEMPQLDAQQTIDFRKYLEDKGYKISEEKQNAAYLRATQNELNGAKVAGVAEYIRSQGGNVKPIIISKDDYILDGHHAWAGKIALDAEDNKLADDLKMDVSRVDISITDLLHEADLFTGGKGHKPASEGA